MRLLPYALMLMIPMLIVPAFAETQTLPTEDGTLDVRLTYDAIEPGNQTRIGIDFINPQTQRVQEHIDYTVAVSKDGQDVFGPIPLTHTSVGSVKIPIPFNQGQGEYTMDIQVEGILFQPIPAETVSFGIVASSAQAQPNNTKSELPPPNGGCLIATAAYGSELAPQVQQLREIRDNTVLSTKSGAAFMTLFNQVYYSFSPAIADLEREHPVFREAIRMALTPMLASLSLLDRADAGSEEEILGYGISIVLLNIGIYIGAPVFGSVTLYRSIQKNDVSVHNGQENFVN